MPDQPNRLVRIALEWLSTLALVGVVAAGIEIAASISWEHLYGGLLSVATGLCLGILARP